MCGICGITKEALREVEAMTHALNHRGPDAHNHFASPQISLGHTRLAILDVSAAGTQPMWSKNKQVCIVFNGEIYNFKELITQHQLPVTTGTDTEVLLLLYQKMGIDFVQQLRGMFAFGLYDFAKETLFLARDPHGIKPNYYCIQNNTLYFASETKALLKVLPQRPAINEYALSLYARHKYIPRPHTLLEGILSLEAGEVVQWQNNTLKTLFVTEQLIPDAYENIDPTDIVGIMQDSVEAHMIADRPIGIFLSGGLDSSVCLYHMQKSGATAINTFTVRFDIEPGEGEAKFNADANIAKRTAEYFETNHQEILMTAKQCVDAYKQTAKFLDQPNANNVAITQYILAQEAKKTVDVVLSGIGGDEIFGGYPRYKIVDIMKKIDLIPLPLRKKIAAALNKNDAVWQTALGTPLMERLLLTPMSQVHPLLQGNWFQPEANSHYIQERLNRLAVTNRVHEFMEYDRLGWLVDEALRLTDASTMGTGLECRTPFLDNRVVNIAHQINPSKHVSGKMTKKMIRDAYQNVLPAEVIHLQKAGFFPPFAKWLRRECKELIDETCESTYINRYFDLDVLRDIAKKHQTGERYGLFELTTLIQLHYWFQEVYND